MTLRKLAAVGVGVALALSMAACSSSSGGSSSSSGASGTTDYSSLVGVVLPTNAESRWPVAEKEFKQAMPGATILYSNNDTATEKTNVESLIAKGVKFIILCPYDATTAASEVEEAHAAGITVISYDRLIMNTADVNYYATFDSVAVGKAQAQYLVDQASGSGNHLYLYAGAATDNNAFLFFQGAWSVLQPKIADGTFVIENSSAATSLQTEANLSHDQEAQIIGQITTNWDPTQAQNLAQANLAAASADAKGTVYLLTPNDDGARPIADAFRADPAVTTIYSTGQDFTQASLQYILDGKQSMTIWKPDSQLVSQCADIVNAVLKGATPDVVDTQYNNGAAEIPATTAQLTIVTKDNAEQVINGSGIYKVDNGQVVPV